MRKDIEQWWKRLQPRGRYIAYAAAVAAVFLLLQLILSIAGVWPALGIFGIVLNVIAITLVTLVITQFFVMRKMQKDYEENMRDMMTKGRRGGNRMEQISGVRNRGSMRQRGGGSNMSGALQMITQVSTENLDKHYRPKPLKKPTIVAEWKEIEGPGMYALESAPKAKVEIIDASDIGGGFFVGKYSPDGIVKERTFMIHRSSGEPLRFGTLRNAKQALAGKSSSKHKKRKSSRKGR